MRIEMAQAGDSSAVVALLGEQFREHGTALGLEQLSAAVGGVLSDATRGTVLLAYEPEAVGVAVLAFTWTLEHGGLVAWLDELFSGEIDRAMFDAQVARVRAARGECFENLREADTEIDSAYLVTAQRVLELAKHAKTHWDRRSPQQKRELLAEVVCNSRLDGRTLRYDFQKPFDVLAKMRVANDWCTQGELHVTDSVRVGRWSGPNSAPVLEMSYVA